MKGKIQTTTVLLHNAEAEEAILAQHIAKRKKLKPASVEVIDFDFVSVNNYMASVYCGPNAPATGPMPQRDTIIKVKYRVIPGK